MSTEYVERSAAIIGRIEGLDLVPHAARLLAGGEPVAIERLAAAAGRSVEHIEAALGEQTSAERDADELTPDDVERVEPPGAVVTTVRPAGEIADVRSAICQHGQFFASPQAASQWADEHPGGEIRPVEAAFALDRAVVTQLGWAAP